MKLILREYLASLRERDELDAILPDLLSELGFHVYSRPRKGTVQHGVDIAAVGPSADGAKRVYLFSIKKGDLGRQDWDGNPQALRSSLNEILDVYLRSHIPAEYEPLEIVICLCLGGEIHEQVRASVTGYIRQHTSEKVSFQEWNGDKIAGLLLEGILREDLLPKPLRSNFQKAIALLDEPDSAYHHFALLVRQLVAAEAKDPKVRLRAARQIYLCVWIMFVWSRDIGNVEAPYQAAELAMLGVWQLMKSSLEAKAREREDFTRVLLQLVQVYFSIASELLDKKIAPHCKSLDALASAVRSRSSVDVNLKLFELLGRVAMVGLWLHWFASRQEEADEKALRGAAAKYCDVGLSMIENNPTLRLPVADEQATSIGLFLMLCSACSPDINRVDGWLDTIVHRYEFTVFARGRYPTSHTDYRYLMRHPRDRSKEYFEDATAGSTLIPLLAAWAAGLDRTDLVERLAKLAAENFAHCNMQLWSPGRDSEEHMYLNTESHGRAISGLPISTDGDELLRVLTKVCEDNMGFNELSANKVDFWPIVLLACHHWKLPVPPDYWIEMLTRKDDATA